MTTTTATTTKASFVSSSSDSVSYSSIQTALSTSSRTAFYTESFSSISPTSTAGYSILFHPKAQTLESKQGDDKTLLIVTVSFLIIILLAILIVFIYKKFNYLNQRQRPEHDPIPEDTQEPDFDLDNFDIENFDSLAPWERNAHIWINEQILSIKNENFEQ